MRLNKLERQTNYLNGESNRVNHEAKLIALILRLTQFILSLNFYYSAVPWPERLIFSNLEKQEVNLSLIVL